MCAADLWPKCLCMETVYRYAKTCIFAYTVQCMHSKSFWSNVLFLSVVLPGWRRGSRPWGPARFCQESWRPRLLGRTLQKHSNASVWSPVTRVCGEARWISKTEQVLIFSRVFIFLLLWLFFLVCRMLKKPSFQTWPNWENKQDSSRLNR